MMAADHRMGDRQGRIAAAPDGGRHLQRDIFLADFAAGDGQLDFH
jgi:hypothetical protein